MSKTIELGAIMIADWSPKKGKMFSFDFYYSDPAYKSNVATCDPKKVVLPPNKTFTLVIDYPVNINYTAEIKTGKKGLTRLQLANMICKHYRKMYAEEDESVDKPTGEIPGMFNRDFSYGKYQIWGHHITDLILVYAKVEGNNITLGVDS